MVISSGGSKRKLLHCIYIYNYIYIGLVHKLLGVEKQSLIVALNISYSVDKNYFCRTYVLYIYEYKCTTIILLKSICMVLHKWMVFLGNSMAVIGGISSTKTEIATVFRICLKQTLYPYKVLQRLAWASFSRVKSPAATELLTFI